MGPFIAGVLLPDRCARERTDAEARRRSGREARASGDGCRGVPDRPGEGVVGDLLPAVLADEAVRAAGVLDVLHGRGAAGRPVLPLDGADDGRRHDVVDLRADGSRRMSSTDRSSMPGHPGTITSWPCARKRSAHVSQLFGVIHSPWIRTIGVFSVVLICSSPCLGPCPLQVRYADSRPNVLSTARYSRHRSHRGSDGGVRVTR